MTAVFLDYDRAALDREYDNRGKVADFDHYLEGYRGRSASARERHDCQLGVAYGPGASETLDLFLAPAAKRPAPVVVFIHGGYWKMLSKNEFSYVADGLVPHGVTTAVIDYSLMPAATMGELVRQCRAAVAWLWHHADTFGGDRERIVVAGHSAGGHLTATTLATDWPRFDGGLPVGVVKAGCGVSGLYDLVPIQRCFLNDDLALSDADVAAHSPISLPAPGVPLALPLGGDEGEEYLRQSRALAEAWPSARVDVMKGENHFSIIDQLARPDSALSRVLLGLLK